jgi:hypothetical protein
MRLKSVFIGAATIWILGGNVTANAAWQTITVGNNPRGLTVGSVTGDGHQDLVVANFGAPSFIGQDMPASVTGTLQLFSLKGEDLLLKAETTVGVGPRSVAVLPDGLILVSLYGQNMLKTYRYQFGRLVENQDVTTAFRPVGLAESDGVAAVACYGDSKVSIYPVSNNGRLGDRSDVATVPGTTAVAVGHLFGHGLPQVGVACLASDKILILSASGDTKSFALAKTISFPAGSGPADLRFADVDGDGLPDIVAVLFGGKSVAVMLQNASGDFESPVLTALNGASPNGLTVVKKGSDSLVAVAERDSDQVELFKWNSGKLSLVESDPVDSTPSAMGPVEVVGLTSLIDGHPMWVTTHMRSGSLRVVKSESVGAVAQPTATMTVTATPTPIEMPSTRVTPTPTPLAVSPLSDQTTLAYPNPSHGKVTIQFTLDESKSVDVRIFNMTGRQVWSAVLPAGSVQMGTNQLNWDGLTASKSPVATGVYVCRIASGTHTVTKKIFIIH